MMERRGASRRHEGERHVARGRQIVIGGMRDAERVEMPPHWQRRPRCIGDQDDAAAAGAKAHERIAGALVRFAAVMDDAPDIAKDDIVAGRQGARPSMTAPSDRVGTSSRGNDMHAG